MTITHLNGFQVMAMRKDSKIGELSLDNIFSKIILPLWISQLEVEYQLILSENAHFTNSFINKYNVVEESLVDKWLLLIDYFFKKQYLKHQDKELNALTLGMTSYSRYCTIKSIIIDDVKPFVELRNKLVHGQWAVAINMSRCGKNQELTTNIWKLSKKDMMLAKAFIKNLPPLIKLLITSKKTFERDYDKFTHRILKAKNDADLKFEWLKRKTATNKS